MPVLPLKPTELDRDKRFRKHPTSIRYGVKPDHDNSRGALGRMVNVRGVRK